MDVFTKVIRDFQSCYSDGFIPRDDLALLLQCLGIDKDLLNAVPCVQGAENGLVKFEDFVKWVLADVVATRTPSPSQAPATPEDALFSPRTSFDLVVLGGGPCGLKAAEDAAARGKNVAIIEPAPVLTGAPTGAHSKCLREAVLHGAKTWSEVQELLTRAMSSTQHQAARVLRTFQVTLLRGLGGIVDANTVQVTPVDGSVGDVQLKTGAIIIATGSRSNRFPPTNFSMPGVYDSDTIGTLRRIPKRMVIQGAGIISVEYALIFAKLGTHVIMTDACPDFLPMLDSSLRDAVKKTLEDHKIEVIMGLPFKRVRQEPRSTPQMPALRIDAGKRTFGCDVLLSACGRSGNTQNLGLENLEHLGLKINPRGKLIEVNENGYTGVGHVYAVGDVATGSMGLATMGQAQAARAVRALFSGARISNDASVKPSAIWTIPELAWAGMTEAQAEATVPNYGVAKVDFKGTIKGCITNQDGFLKLLFDRDSGKILGVHLFGDSSCELVNYGAEAVNAGDTIYQMLRFVFPAVTYHNLYSRAATECKLRLHGAKNLEAANAWKQIIGLVETSLKASQTPMKVSEAISKAFLLFDKDHCGFLTKKQLQAALVSLGMDPDENEAEKMMCEATDGLQTDKLDYMTFLAVLKQNADAPQRVWLEEAMHEGEETHERDFPELTTPVKKGIRDMNNTLTSFAKAGDYDAVVLGAGPAGLKAAAECGARGKRVVLIDPSERILGVPTGGHSKCLREAVLGGARTWAEVSEVLMNAEENAKEQAALDLHTFHVKQMRGWGTIEDEHTVLFKGNDGEEKKLHTDAIIIATGSKANRFPPTDFRLPGVYDSDTIRKLDRIPEKIVVQGAGIVSVEYAMIFAKLGSEVAIIDAFDQWLPMLDECLQDTIWHSLEENGVEIILNTAFKSVSAGPDSTSDSPSLSIDIGGRVLQCDTLLAATGRSGCSQNLGLEKLTQGGLKIARGKLIEADEYGYTGVARIYAVGDVATGSMMLATMGQQQAVLAARALFSSSGKMSTEKAVEHKPCGVWTLPEVAWVGATEAAAKRSGVDYSIAKVDFTQTLRGCVTNEDGYLKLIFDRNNGCIIGVHLYGENSCELVNFGAELVNQRLTVFQVLHFVFPAVTYHQLYHNAAAEAKLRFKGAKDLAGATAWWNLQRNLEKHLEEEGLATSVSEVLLRAFLKFDNDNSGILTQEEVYLAVNSLGLSTSEESIKAMVLEATGDMNAQEVDYKSLLKMVGDTRKKSKQALPE